MGVIFQYLWSCFVMKIIRYLSSLKAVAYSFYTLNFK